MWLGEALWLSDRLEDAHSVAEHALALIRQSNHHVCEPWVLRLLGEIAADRAPSDVTAGWHYRQALALAEELGMRPLVAHCHLGLGKLYLRTGQREQAQEHLRAATTMYREMGMTYWLDQAGRELRRL